MLTIRFVVGMFPAGLMVLGAGGVFGQDYPNRPIRLVTTSPGGGLDFAARLFAPGLTRGLGQTVIIENRGGGVTPIETVAKAPPDGYTLLFNSGSTWILPFLQTKAPYDPVRDLAPITLVEIAPSVLVVHPSLPVKSVKELIALAKARPGELNYAAGSIGSSTHLSPELFKAMTGVDIVHIFYKSSGPALIDLIAGHVQVMFASPGGVEPHVKAGRVRALAVTTAAPSELLPGLPTVAASGLPGYESVVSHGMFAPAKTPQAIIQRLHRETVRVIHLPEVKERLLKSGVEPVGNSPEEFGAYIKSDMVKWGKVIKDAGIRAD
ncbi:MAG: tripartite tricarboxylate transporter substrate binding protein [Betaproteobacteria bacterium]|nr:tripartite tricarboxylate transporter substrate binding protein [Betaproteobacteria bacterium]